MKKLVITMLLLSICGCQTLDTALVDIEKDVATDDSVVAQKTGTLLHWETTDALHPERRPWSVQLISSVNEHFTTYSIATDIATFCPKYKTLNKEQKVKAWSELFVALSYYECGYNPKSASVDVGTKDDLGSWSVGLFQMSSNDESSKKYKATFETLKDPLVNIKVATEQMRKQIVNTGKIVLTTADIRNRYWAPLITGWKKPNITNIDGISLRVKKYSSGCK